MLICAIGAHPDIFHSLQSMNMNSMRIRRSNRMKTGSKSLLTGVAFSSMPSGRHVVARFVYLYNI